MNPTAPMMLAALLLSAPTLAAAAPAPSAVEKSLDALRWKARPIVLIAPSADDPRLEQARAALWDAAAQVERRDMVARVIITDQHPLRDRFAVRGQTFAAILVGKDGGEKARVSRLDDLKPWFALVDSMPMRMREMRERGETPAQ